MTITWDVSTSSLQPDEYESRLMILHLLSLPSEPIACANLGCMNVFFRFAVISRVWLGTSSAN